MPRIEGAYSTVVMTKEAVVAFRDPHGVRPLSLGKLGDELRRRLRELRLRHHRRRADARDQARRDGLARPARPRGPAGGEAEDDRVLRLRAHLLLAPRLAGSRGGSSSRCAAGWARSSGREAPVDADLVISVPDSGNPAAARLRPRLGNPQGRRADQEPLRRPHLHPARPGAAQARAADEVQPAAGDRRRQAARRRRRFDRPRQHHPRRSSRCSARPAPRRSTCGSRPRRSATPVTTGSTCRPREEMIAHERTIDEIAEHLGADSLAYLSLEGVYEAVGTPAEDHCDACFTGHYPLGDGGAVDGKFALEATELPRRPLSAGSDRDRLRRAAPRRSARLRQRHEPAGDPRPLHGDEAGRGRRRRLRQAGGEGARARRRGRDRRPRSSRRPSTTATGRRATTRWPTGSRGSASIWSCSPATCSCSAPSFVGRFAGRIDQRPPGAAARLPGTRRDRPGARPRRPGDGRHGPLRRRGRRHRADHPAGAARARPDTRRGRSSRRRSTRSSTSCCRGRSS